MQISEVKSKIKRCNDEVTNDNRTQAQTKGVKEIHDGDQKLKRYLKQNSSHKGAKQKEYKPHQTTSYAGQD